MHSQPYNPSIETSRDSDSCHRILIMSSELLLLCEVLSSSNTERHASPSSARGRGCRAVGPVGQEQGTRSSGTPSVRRRGPPHPRSTERGQSLKSRLWEPLQVAGFRWVVFSPVAAQAREPSVPQLQARFRTWGACAAPGVRAPCELAWAPREPSAGPASAVAAWPTSALGWAAQLRSGAPRTRSRVVEQRGPGRPGPVACSKPAGRAPSLSFPISTPATVTIALRE